MLNADFSVDPNGTDIANEYLYTGRRLDPETHLQLNRIRFYGSHIGRWVNRDPARYYGGYNLYAYVGGMPTYFEDPTGLNPYVDWPPGYPWETIDFFIHYCGWPISYWGEDDGPPVDLGDIGLLDDFRDRINPGIGVFKRKLRRRLSTSCENPRDHIEGKEEVPYAIGGGGVFDPLSVMGEGSVTVNYECEERALCETCCPQNPPILIRKVGRCRLKIEVHDRFSNPTDRGGPYNDKSQWWGCKPYDITGNWSDSYTWSEEFGECP